MTNEKSHFLIKINLRNAELLYLYVCDNDTSAKGEPPHAPNAKYRGGERNADSFFQKRLSTVNRYPKYIKDHACNGKVSQKPPTIHERSHGWSCNCDCNGCCSCSCDSCRSRSCVAVAVAAGVAVALAVATCCSCSCCRETMLRISPMLQ